ncbi:unnamed protein product [marine sediment metagenome]|uniref:Uncharacterized protein n=1 Tax=marine sediment metagenome TaxID=412755 RepID=X1R734_9ZZZZ
MVWMGFKREKMNKEELDANVREMQQLKADHPEDSKLWNKLIKIYEEKNDNI